jgi:hypothetical protein
LRYPFDDGKITRREFLRRSSSCAGLLLLNLYGTGLSSSLRPGSRNGLYRQGGMIYLPGHGKLFVASDFHSRYSDFERWLQRTRLCDRLLSGEDVYGLIVGDVVDMKSGDSETEEGGDTRIIQRIREIQNDPAIEGDRLIYIAGNHEDRCVSIYEKLVEEDSMTPENQQQVVKDLFSGERESYYRQFNFLSRMDDDSYSYLKKLPIAVMTESGIVGIHAGPSRSLVSPKDIIISPDYEVIQEILWSRPVEARKDGYDSDDLFDFLRRMNNSTLIVSGHTPLSYLPEEMTERNVGEYGNHQIILATSYGSEPREKSFLELDLKIPYANTTELITGQEIRPLLASLAQIEQFSPIMSITV